MLFYILVHGSLLVLQANKPLDRLRAFLQPHLQQVNETANL